MNRYLCLLSFLSGLVGCGGATGSITDLSGDGGGDGGGGNALADAAADAANPQSDGSTTDGGPGGNLTHVACGTTSCSLPDESCCVYEAVSPPTFMCVHGAACPATDGGDRKSVV